MGLEQESEPGSSGGGGASFKMLGAVGGLGIEMAAAVVAGALIGEKCDEVLGTGSLLTILGVLLGVMAFGAHVRYLLRRAKGAEQEADSGDGSGEEEEER